jgi:hypothetical protein
VLNQLTKYLLQYRQVVIPSVGTILLKQESPRLEVADKIIYPPTYAVELGEGETVPEHQLRFLSRLRNEPQESVMETLRQTGEQLRQSVAGEGFHWKGVGIIRRGARPGAMETLTLSPVQAERVLRRDAEHNVLVGDKERTVRSAGTVTAEDEMAPVNVVEDEAASGKKRSVNMTIGWILLVLSILFILFILYQGRFRLAASGSRQAPTSQLHLQKWEQLPVHTDRL